MSSPTTGGASRSAPCWRACWWSTCRSACPAAVYAEGGAISADPNASWRQHPAPRRRPGGHADAARTGRVEFNRPRRTAARTFRIAKPCRRQTSRARSPRSATRWPSSPTGWRRCCGDIVAAARAHRSLRTRHQPPGSRTRSCASASAAGCSRSCRRSRPTCAALRALRHRAAPHARDPLGRGLALTAAALVLFAVLWTAMLMKVSTAGIVHRPRCTPGRSSWSRTACGRSRWWWSSRRPAPLGKLPACSTSWSACGCAGRCPSAAASSCSPARVSIWAMLEVLLLGVFVAYTKLGDLVHVEVGPAVLALGVLTVVALWADTALDPDAVWEAIERRGQTQAPMPDDRPLVFRPGAWAARPAGWSACPRRPACAAARRCIRASPTASSPHLGVGHRRRDPLHPGQRLSGADRDPARRRRSPAPSSAASSS